MNESPRSVIDRDPGALISLLPVYAAQFASYTTLLWQVPVLALTAQSFLLTIALGHDSSRAARLFTAGLAAAIAVSSAALMYYHRGQAVNYGHLAQEVSKKLHLADALPIVTDRREHPVPRSTDAEDIWTHVSHNMFNIWLLTAIVLFFLADATIFVSVLAGASWFG
jgi:hypothetical protein